MTWCRFFQENSLLAEYRPDLLHLLTTNGEHCTGDGIKVGAPIGAKTIVVEWVQVHRTGLVNLVDQDAKTKSTQMRELCSGGRVEGRALRGRGDSIGRQIGFQIAWLLHHPSVHVGGAPDAASGGNGGHSCLSKWLNG